MTLPCADAAALVLVVFSFIGKPISLCSLFLGAAVPHASHTVQIAETDRLHSEHPLARSSHLATALRPLAYFGTSGRERG